MPVTLAAPVILLMVLAVVLLFVLVLFIVITLTFPLPAVQFVNVLFWIVLVALPASALAHPLVDVAPVKVIFEKLLLLLVMVLPETEVAVEVYRVTALPAAFVNVPTILLLLMFWVPLEDKGTLFEINVTPPLVLRLRLLNVLPLIDWESVGAVLLIKKTLQTEAGGKTVLLMLLLLIESLAVAVPPWLNIKICVLPGTTAL